MGLQEAEAGVQDTGAPLVFEATPDGVAEAVARAAGDGPAIEWVTVVIVVHAVLAGLLVWLLANDRRGRLWLGSLVLVVATAGVAALVADGGERGPGSVGLVELSDGGGSEARWSLVTAGAELELAPGWELAAVSAPVSSAPGYADVGVRRDDGIAAVAMAEGQVPGTTRLVRVEPGPGHGAGIEGLIRLTEVRLTDDRLSGTVVNDSEVTLIEPAVLLGLTGRRIGELGPGQRADFEMSLSDSDRLLNGVRVPELWEPSTRTSFGGASARPEAVEPAVLAAAFSLGEFTLVPSGTVTLVAWTDELAAQGDLGPGPTALVVRAPIDQEAP